MASRVKDDRIRVWAFFLVCSAVLIAAGIVIPLSVHDGPMLWPLALMGSIIIISLLSAAAVPHLRRTPSALAHHPRQG